MYTYILKMDKDHREEVKERLPSEFTEYDVKFTVDKFESARPLWQLPEEEIKNIVMDRIQYLTEEDVPDGHELEDKEHVRLIVDWDSDKVVFDDEVEVPKPERDRRGRDRARRRF
jgi:thymidine kinase